MPPRLFVALVLVLLTSANLLATRASANGKPFPSSILRPPMTVPFLRVDNILQFDEKGRPLPDAQRMDLDDAASKLGLTAADTVRIKRTVGSVWCDGKNGDTHVLGTGFLLTNSVLVTAASNLMTEFDTMYPGVTACYFGNKIEDHSTREQIPVDAAHVRRLAHIQKYIALVRLKGPVAGAVPFDIDRLGQELEHRAPLLAVTSVQEGTRINPRHTVVQKCSHRREPAWEIGLKQEHVERNDCSTSLGANGGLTLARRGGRLIIISMLLESGGDTHPDGVPFDWESGAYTNALFIDETVLTAAIEFSHEKFNKTAKATKKSDAAASISGFYKGDPRRPIKVIGANLGLSTDEIGRAMKTVGTIRCEDRPGHTIGSATGFWLERTYF